MVIRRIIVTLGVASAIALAVGVAAPGIAAANTATTAVGTLTATQATGTAACNDLGANIIVTVTSGFPNTAYVATGGGISTTAQFNTNASGSGSAVVRNVNPPHGSVGTGTITVTAAGSTGQVTVAIDCPNGKGG